MSNDTVSIPVNNTYKTIFKGIAQALDACAVPKEHNCDICGCKTTNTQEILIPLYNKYGYSRTVITPMIACDDCKEKIAACVSEMKYGEKVKWFT